MGIWVHSYAVLHVQLEVNLIWPLKPALIVVNDAWPLIGVRLLAGDPPHSRPLHLPHLHPDLLVLFFGTCQNQHGDNRGLRFCYATSCACLWSFKSIEPFHLVYMLPYILWFVYSNFSAVAMLKEKSPPPNAVNPGSQFNLLPRDLLIPWSSTFTGLKWDGTFFELFKDGHAEGGTFCCHWQQQSCQLTPTWPWFPSALPQTRMCRLWNRQ